MSVSSTFALYLRSDHCHGPSFSKHSESVGFAQFASLHLIHLLCQKNVSSDLLLVIYLPLRLQQAFDTSHIVIQVLNHYHVKTDVGEVDRLEHSELSALHI